jgi:hypothetical protein
MSKTSLILTGLTLDKALFNSILKMVENDRHIRYAREKVGKSVRKKIAVNVASELCNLATSFSIGAGFIEGVQGVSILALLAFAGSTIVTNIQGGLSSFAGKIDLTNKNNFDYWKIFFSNLSDTQTLISSTLQNRRTKQIYCDRPYYENKYIDSLLIEIKCKDGINKREIKNLINKHIESVFYAEFICENIELDSYTKKRAEAILSKRGLFGIYFLSGLLWELYKDEEVIFEFSRDLMPDSNSLNEDGVFVRELVLLAGNPGKVKFCSQGNGNGDNIIKLIRIDHGISQDKSNKSKGKFDQLFYENAQDDGYVRVVVPIKRIVSMPVSYVKKLGSLERIPEPYERDIYPLPDVFQEDDLLIFAVGGGEHNFPLVHLVNIMRYKDAENRRFGFVENAFDRQMRGQANALPEFMIAVEKFVSGLNALARTRVTSQASVASREPQIYSNEAEVLRIEFDKRIEGYAIYGYSAPMTRYAFLGLLYALDKRNNGLFIEDESRHKYKRTKYCNFGLTKIAVYCIGKDKEEFQKVMNEFDKMDGMNNFEKNQVKTLIINNLFLMPRG